jgi:hypothetical protein
MALSLSRAETSSRMDMGTVVAVMAMVRIAFCSAKYSAPLHGCSDRRKPLISLGLENPPKPLIYEVLRQPHLTLFLDPSFC